MLRRKMLNHHHHCQMFVGSVFVSFLCLWLNPILMLALLFVNGRETNGASFSGSFGPFLATSLSDLDLKLQFFQ